MSMVQAVPARCDLPTIEAALESFLAMQLKDERALLCSNFADDLELYDQALDAFVEWADAYGLPTTAHVLATFLIELPHVHHVEFADLQTVARGFVFRNVLDVHVPVRAALNYCAESAGRLVRH
jgi:hypothetical protein